METDGLSHGVAASSSHRRRPVVVKADYSRTICRQAAVRIDALVVQSAVLVERSAAE